MDLASEFKNVRVLVAGDVMLDRFWWGDVTRISPEAPVPVVRLRESSVAAGGAANVAANISALGATPVLLGCIGTDIEGVELTRVISNSGIVSEGLIAVSSRKTTVKTRIIAHSQQIARVDHETAEPLSIAEAQRLLEAFDRSVSEVDAIVLSDYAKGCLSEEVIAHIISSAEKTNIPIIVDPKGRNYSKYSRATVLTPNRREAAHACNLDDEGRSVTHIAGPKLLDDLELDAVLVTEGPDGMTLFERERPPFKLPASAREVFDSTGAGDTVIAALSVALGAGMDMRKAASIANAAAGIVVEKLGTATVPLAEVAATLGLIDSQNA